MDAKKFIDINGNSEEEDIYAEKVYDRALIMKDNAIKKAKEDEITHHDKSAKLLKYNELLKEARKIGATGKDFDKALNLMQKAVKLMPEEPEALWGLATSLHHSGKLKESLKEYKKLVKTFPDNNTFQFEYAQVLLRDNQLQAGLKEIGKVMKVTDEFDNFLARLGEIYIETKMFKEALIAFNSYLEKFPYDYKIWHKKGDCLQKLGREKQSQKAYDKALQIKPDFKSE